jgi:hypothetical protein
MKTKKTLNSKGLMACDCGKLVKPKHPSVGDVICNECIEKRTLITQTVAADWKDIESLLTQMKRALKVLGVEMIDHPDFNGSDMYGFILSNRPLTENEVAGLTIFPSGEDE